MIGMIANKGTTLSDRAVADLVGILSNIRNRGTMIIPPPSPERETTEPANKPTKMGFRGRGSGDGGRGSGDGSRESGVGSRESGVGFWWSRMNNILEIEIKRKMRNT